MARRRREVEVFTMSSLNMLSKALGAVILLFIIIPKVTVKDKARLKRLPPELDMIVCNSNSLKVMRGDSVLIMHKFDSVETEFKSQIAMYDSLLNKLKCIKEHIKLDKKEKPAIVAGTGNGNNGVKLQPDEVIGKKEDFQKTPSVSECDNDAQAPSISGCPQNITVTAEAAKNCATASWATPTATDNCGAAGLTVSSAPTKDLRAYSCFPIGVTTVTYNAKDVKGNESQCAFTVTVDKKGSTDNGGGGGGTTIIPTDIPFPTPDPVTIYLEWSGDKDIKVELSAKNTTTGGWSGWNNFNSSASWMTYHTNKRGAFKYFTQNPLSMGDYEIYAYVSRGKSAKVKGAAVLKSADGKKVIAQAKISEKEIGVEKKGVLIGTVRVTTNTITFK